MIQTRQFPLSSSQTVQRARGRADSSLRRVQKLRGFAAAQRILGVDPGLHITGYGVIEAQQSTDALPSWKLVEGGVLRARATDTLPQRLQTLHVGLAEVLREHTPDIVVIEDLFSTYAHPRSALLMAHARGVLMLAAQEANVVVHTFTPNEVKQVVSGNGHASKSAMQNAVRQHLKLAAPPNPPDVADALALALCFAARWHAAQQIGEATAI